MKIGFIGQGWIGRHYADEFEARMYNTVRYSLESEYVGNKEKIKDCKIVFIAVPTPTTEKGFDDSMVRDALTCIGEGNIAVIKSTLLPGTTEKLQNAYPNIFVVHSPEFLVEKSAAYDAAKPKRNIIGLPNQNPEYHAIAGTILKVLPEAPYNKIMSSKDAELLKYAGNCFLFTKIVFMNVLYDLIQAQNGNFETVVEAMKHDPRIGESHMQVLHSSGRGAGGHCFIKDFEAFRRLYRESTGDELGLSLLTQSVQFNNALLKKTHKDLDLLSGVYGPDFSVN